MNNSARTKDAGGAWQHWTTPADFLDRVRKIGPIMLDPCGNHDDVVNAMTSWHSGGMERSWFTQGGLVFVNPPYGRALAPWTEKMRIEAGYSCEIVALLPAAMGPAWMHDNVLRAADAACIVRGRLKFGNPPPSGASSSTFDNFVAYWGPRVDSFFDAFDGLGELMRLKAAR